MATLEQIAAALKAADAAGNVDDAKRLAAAYRQAQASAGPRSLTGKIEPQGSTGEQSTNIEGRPEPAQPARPDFLTSAAATVNGLSQSVPFLQNVTDALGGTIAQLTGGSYSGYVGHQRDVRDQLARTAPLARLSGELAGYVGGTSAIGATKLGAEALGLTGKLGQRVANSAVSGAGLSTLDSLSRGETGGDALTNAAVGGLVSGAFPLVGTGFRAAGRGLNEKVVRPFMTLANRENEAASRISRAIAQDTASGARMSAADEATAAKAGIDVVNADRFGSAIRNLTRAATNINPEADNAFKGLTDQRFLTQGNRAVNFVRQLMGGATDDLGYQKAILDTARVVNKQRYEAAYSSPNAKAIWSPQIRQLLTSDDFKAAIREADRVGANEAAISGQKAIRNPFTFDADGNVTGLRKLPGGGVALPNLEYWDIVQRTLRNKADQLARSGDNLGASQVRDMRGQLLNTLDGAVPEFKKARQGAAGFFGADDAIEAGRKAATSTKQTPEIERAVAAMSPAEKDAFAIGFSSELIDAINASRDRVNVITSVFGSQSARDRIRIALGPQKARELEAYVKVEQAVHMLKDAVSGNSSTAKQLIAAGVLGGGGGLLLSGGDLQQGANWATIAALGRRGMQMLGKRVDDQVMKLVAEALVSNDPAKIQKAIQNASLSKAHMDAIEGVMLALAAPARGLALPATALAMSGAP